MKKVFTLLAWLLIIAFSCNQPHDHSHDEEEAIPPVAFTSYSDKTELFVDFPYLIAGKPTTLMVHLTRLGEKFQPIQNGKITVNLNIEGKTNSIKTESQSNPGIYEVEIIPEIAGTGKLIFDIQSAEVSEKFVFEDIEVFSDLVAVVRNQKEATAANEISYLKPQAWNIDFANEPVRKTNFREILKSSGQVLAAPGDETVITANSSGAILFASNKTIIGSTLNVGDHLFTISGGNLAQQNPEVYYKETKAKYELAKVEFERAEILVKDKIISQKDYLQSKLEFENMQASFQAVSKNYSASGQKVTSNSTGFLKNLLVSEGQYVEPGTPLAIISKNKKALLQANVSQKYFQKLALISAANFKIVSDESVFNTEEMNGKVISYGKSTSENASYIPITFEIDNIGNIIPGSVAEVFLKSNTIPDALVIPISALMEEQGNFFVFVQTGGETFEKREIKLGGNDGRHVQVHSGLKEGERVVTKGAYAIKLASASGAIPEHGHSH
ncbi:efflux RND transporter periplasmic adaptor subunit [Aquiflexum gelatinilyticum]|uniref:Efflux RND transporter periplasmic adaptor subunit n=1 Tax=Aquiflexum gelatinilyticum TaxID=2961943 RepID=A0A9X2SYL0_9BACT|nr:efflux RND transporter periplasmic adaptor subunit [Aquiflexum gelatinilyticum]MCR9015289.1 efflux RND transporter periplasmic adaptor subunit [Aquiflexum gelatinilyticum]